MPDRSKTLITTQHAALATNYQGDLYAYIASLMGDREQVMDVLQETNRILLEKADQFQPGTNFIAWAFQIARYEVLKAVRNANSRGLNFNINLIEQLAGESTSQASSIESEMRALSHCLEKLPAQSRTLIASRYERGASVNALAASHNQKPNTIAKALHRIRMQLFECIQRRLASEEGPA